MEPGRQPGPTVRLRGRLWVEIENRTGLTEAGADLLAQIEATGSLSEAARRLGFSYRRAWMLLDMMNRIWPTPLVATQTGGRRGGGAQLTEHGHAVLEAYRDLQLQLEYLLDQALPGFGQRLAAVGIPKQRSDTPAKKHA